MLALSGTWPDKNFFRICRLLVDPLLRKFTSECHLFRDNLVRVGEFEEEAVKVSFTVKTRYDSLILNDFVYVK